jgi:predicted secreted hydrolase
MYDLIKRITRCVFIRAFAPAFARVFTVLVLIITGASPIVTFAAAPQFQQVKPERALTLPADYGAHPDFRTEWWYVTGWLNLPDGKPIGFQITFFRTGTEHDRANPSAFAPKQLIIAHAALSDPALGRLQHDQKVAREGFGIAYAKTDKTNVAIDDWHLERLPDGHYQASIRAREFTLQITLTPTQPPMLQGEAGISRKGPLPAQASYYYSEPHLKATANLTRGADTVAATGSAWLDHEWSSSYLDPQAVGWDWVGLNLEQGAALMAFRMRRQNGEVLFAHAGLRDASGKITQFPAEQVRFTPLRQWRSPRTDAVYPVAMQLQTGPLTWQLTPLQDDQELDSRQSTGAVYWEGAVRVHRDGHSVGQGYLELTGYVKPLKL